MNHLSIARKNLDGEVVVEAEVGTEKALVRNIKQNGNATDMMTMTEKKIAEGIDMMTVVILEAIGIKLCRRSSVALY